jgi:hypothetical protein
VGDRRPPSRCGPIRVAVTDAGAGAAAGTTQLLVNDPRRCGITLIFLSAGDDDVARIDERVGFRRIATACIAEPASGS